MNDGELEEQFLALTMEIGLLNNEQLREAGIKENDYFNINDDMLWKLESYSNKKRHKK